jgi:hypothetical protein
LRLRVWGCLAESLILGVERKRQFGVKSLGLAAGGDRGEERFWELTAKTLGAGSLRLDGGSLGLFGGSLRLRG